DDWRDAFYYHYYELGTHNVAAHYGVVTPRYKLVHYYRELDENRQPRDIDYWNLMDRQADPLEMTSFHNDPSYASVKAELSKKLDDLRAELKVPET
ncbi:MAG: DUF4976 domain-containing protein, partial [Burkholderiales bacterium]|nr:DUF4976 domain-containing protein [Burkholderiales bacterium]